MKPKVVGQPAFIFLLNHLLKEKQEMSLLLADGSAFVGDLAMDLLSFCGCHYRPIYVTDLDEVYRGWKKLIAHGANTIYSSHANKPFGIAELVKTLKRYGLD